MAKMTGPLQLKGKMNGLNMVFSETREGIIASSSPKKRGKNMPPQFIVHTLATDHVNGLAGTVSRLLHLYSPRNVENRLYRTLLSKLRKAKSTVRLIMLHALENLEAHPGNKLDDVLPYAKFNVTEEEDGLTVLLSYPKHPHMEKDHNFYKMQVILLSWNSKNNELHQAAKYTRFIDPHDKVMTYTFPFALPEHTTEYMLVGHCIRCEEKSELRLPPKDTLKIMKVGSLDKLAVAVLEVWQEERLKALRPVRRNWVQEDDGIEGDEG